MEQIDIEKVFSNYSSFKEIIGEFFDCDCVWYNIILMLEEKWTDYGAGHDEIGWEPLIDEEGVMDGFNYSCDIYGTSRWEKDDFVMVVGGDGCGNRDIYIFRKSNKVVEDA